VAATSSIEIVFVLGLAATVGGTAVAQTLRAVDDARGAGAARYLAAKLRQTRMEAVARGSAAALKMNRTASGYQFSTVLDGNGNGVLAADIARGIDRPIGGPDTLGRRFPGVDFGALPGLPAVDAGSPAPGADPIRLGAGDGATFTPIGTATPGSVYILGRGDVQYVVRIFGETGKTRVLRFDRGTAQWTPLSGL
jgi:hypothetical protein